MSLCDVCTLTGRKYEAVADCAENSPPTSYVTKAGRIECKDELEAYIKEHGKPVDDGIDPNDRTTWVCRKDGKWLSEHPESV